MAVQILHGLVQPIVCMMWSIEFRISVYCQGKARGGWTWPRELSLDWNKIAFQNAFYRKLH